MMEPRLMSAVMESNQQCRPESRLGLGVIWFLWFANLYDMGGGFGIKYVSIAVAVLYLVPNFRALPTDRPTTHLLIYIFLLWPLLSLLHGLYAGADTALAVSQVTPFLVAVIYVFVSQQVSPDRAIAAFFGIMFSLAIVVFVMYGLLWLNLPGSEYLLLIFQSAEHGYFGYRSIGGTELPNVYFKATLFFVPTYVYYLYKGNFIKALLILVALILAVSKAGFAICLAFSVGYFFMFKTDKRRKTAIVVTFLILTPLFLGFQHFTEALVESVTGQSETSQVRLSYLGSLYDLFGGSPLLLLVGQGTGVPFYSEYLGEFVANIEVDFLNSIRKFGLLWFLVFAALILTHFYKLFRSAFPENRIIGLALLAMFFAAGTNPVLISPPFLMFLMLSLDLFWRKDAAVR